jgi:DNA anti-recombination protein RmuC
MTTGEDVVARAERDPKFRAKVIAKLQVSARDLKDRLAKVERALNAFKKIK